MAQYDIVFKWVGDLFQTLILSLGSSAEKASDKTVYKIVTSICNSRVVYYNGTNAQYHPWEMCYNFLTKKIRVQQNFELVMNTLM